MKAAWVYARALMRVGWAVISVAILAAIVWGIWRCYIVEGG